MDWTLVGTIITAVAAVIVAILQNRGKTAAAAETQKVGALLTTVIKGVEKHSKADPPLVDVKGYIKVLSQDEGVQAELHEVVVGLFPKKTS